MNYLAHCFLAEHNCESVVGNLLGDFCRGVNEQELDGKVYLGLLNHRAVDRFTDSHALVVGAKQYFSPQRRRFAGIALDVLFDHYLIKNWHCYSDQTFEQYKREIYVLLQRAQGLMPLPMQVVMRSVVDNDWFANYQSLDGIGFALDRIAGRIRFSNKFAGCLYDIRRYDLELEAIFKQFFAQLLLFNNKI